MEKAAGPDQTASQFEVVVGVRPASADRPDQDLQDLGRLRRIWTRSARALTSAALNSPAWTWAVIRSSSVSLSAMRPAGNITNTAIETA